jgi:Flp pilus assembly protein CpaB
MIIIMTLLMLVAIAAFFIFSPKPKQVAQERQRPPGMIAIPVAKNDIPIGTRISTAMIRLSYVKPSEVPIDAIISPKEFLGRFARSTILASEYLREVNITESGAHSGFSGVAKPGMRIVHINANLFPGALNVMRTGDRIDLLSIESSSSLPLTQGGADSFASSGVTLQGGGTQPGDRNSQARQLARAGNTAATANSNAVVATLIAENAEVMYVPRPSQMQRGKNNNSDFVVLQMSPEDAHVSVLASTIGRSMRVVLRPFSDDTRLTPVKEVKVTTRLPKPSRDPDNIVIINGLQRKQQRPFSETYRTDSENSQRFSPNDDNLLLKGNNQQQRSVESPDLNLYGEY